MSTASRPTGNGRYDVQAGLEFDKPGAIAITTALGYNQLLSTNSVELLAEQGRWLTETLKARIAEASGAKRAALEKKLAILDKMIAFSKSVRDDWSLHEQLAGTPRDSAFTRSISTSISVRCCRRRNF